MITSNKDSVIFYISQYEAVQDLPDEELGKLYRALFNEQIRYLGGEPKYEVELTGPTLMAYKFLVNQMHIDQKKYDQLCKRNKKNGARGGRPKKTQNNPEKPNGFFENPNDNENDNDNENENENDNGSGFSLFGSLENVELTPNEYKSIADKFEDPDGLIDKVSRWLPTAKHDVPDHYETVLSFAKRSNWSKRRILKPPPPEREIDPDEMLTEEESAAVIADITRKLVG